MEVPVCGLRGQTGNAKCSTYLKHVVHILVTAIVWPCWLDLLCLHHAINLHVYMFSWSGHQFSLWPGCQRPRNTGYMATFLFYFLEKLSKWKQRISLIEEMVVLSLNLGDCDPISFVYISFFHNHFLYNQSIFLHNFINCFTQKALKEKYMEIIFNIFVKRQSKRSNKSAGYKLWHLLSIKSIHHIAKENNATWLTAKHINASGWYKLQLTLQYFTVKTFIFSSFPFFSFHFHSDIISKIHCQLLLIFIRNKKIQASALIISQADHKLVLVVRLWRQHWYLLWPLFSHWVCGTFC